MSQPLPPDAIFPAHEPHITTRFLALSTGVRVRIAEQGPANGTPLVLLHGWGASIYTYRHAFARLSRYAIRVIAVDLRGFGLSDVPLGPNAYSLESYCADLDALLDALMLPRANLLGQSMGGGVSLHYALRRPERVRKLVLINPTSLSELSFLVLLLRVAPPKMTELIGPRLVPRWMIGAILKTIAYGDPRRVTPRDIDEYWAPVQLPGHVRAARDTLRQFDFSPVGDKEAAGLAVPSLVILGRQDRLIRTPVRVATRLHDAVVLQVEGGHCAHEEFPDDVYAAVGDFVR